MSVLSRSICISFLLLTAITLTAEAQIPPTKKPPKKPAEAKPAAAKSLRYVMTQEPLYTGLLGKVEGGVAQVAPPPADALGPGPLPLGIVTEGLFLAISFPDPRMPMVNATLSRVRVTEVGEGGAITLELADAAAKGIKPGRCADALPPRGGNDRHHASRAGLRPADDGRRRPRQGWPRRRHAHGVGRITSEISPWRCTTSMPPTASSRRPWCLAPTASRGTVGGVLILPFLEETPLYQQYKFSEPWDGPNNSKLIDKMPELYRDPIHGQKKEHFTHYAAITGEGTAFPRKGHGVRRQGR